MHLHDALQATTRPIISARLQQLQLAERDHPEHTTAGDEATIPPRKDPAAHRTKRAAADRSSSKKKEPDSNKSDELEACEDHEARKPKTKKKKKAVHTAAENDKVEDSSVSTPNYTDEFSYPGLGCNRLMQMYDSAYDGYAEERHGKDEEIKVCTDENAEGDGGHSTPHG